MSGTLNVTGNTERTIHIEQTTQTLAVDAGHSGVPITIERHADGATTTQETGPDGTVGCTVDPGDCTVHNETESSRVSIQENSVVGIS